MGRVWLEAATLAYTEVRCRKVKNPLRPKGGGRLLQGVWTQGFTELPDDRLRVKASVSW